MTSRNLAMWNRKRNNPKVAVAATCRNAKWVITQDKNTLEVAPATGAPAEVVNMDAHKSRDPVDGVIEPLKTDDTKYLLHKPVYFGEK